MHFCYNFYREWSQLGKSSFRVPPETEVLFCHSTSNVSAADTSALLSNNRKRSVKTPQCPRY